MSTRFRITHLGGDKSLAVLDQNGDQVVRLDAEGDVFEDGVHDERTFTVAEVDAD